MTCPDIQPCYHIGIQVQLLDHITAAFAVHSNPTMYNFHSTCDTVAAPSILETCFTIWLP